MTQDEIIEMARQTGVLAGYEGEPSLLIIFAKAMMNVEREACAKIADELHQGYAHDIAMEIRARGQAC